MERDLDYEFEFADDVAAVENKDAASTPSWSERHPSLSGLAGTAALIALILTMVYAFGGGAAVGGLLRLVAVALLSVVRDVPWWGWALILAYPVLRGHERASNERWNITRELMEANCKLLAQVRDELRNHRTGS